MTTLEYINTAVDNEFNTLYERNLVKCYLYFWLLKKPETNRQYFYFEIAGLLLITPKMVSNYLWRMEKEGNRRNDPFLKPDFETKFDNIEKACVMYVQSTNILDYRRVCLNAAKRTTTTRKELINNYNLN